MTNQTSNDPNAPFIRVVRHIVLHVLYLALSVAIYFGMAELGFDVAIHIYFVVVLLIPLVVWLATLARRRLSRGAGGRTQGS